ncbi:MAG: PH domain-containing protein, partial [Proteobacteria bacterium]|nr:PH domain-containing protein [Pseudomonadota bacterium]
MSTEAIFAIERPHPKLFTLYVLRSILSGPLIFVVFPVLFFRYHTLRYRFDAEGVS